MGAGAAVQILWALAVDRESGRHEMRKGPSSSSMNGPGKVAARTAQGQVSGRWSSKRVGVSLGHACARSPLGSASKRRFISLAGVGVCQWPACELPVGQALVWQEKSAKSLQTAFVLKQPDHSFCSEPAEGGVCCLVLGAWWRCCCQTTRFTTPRPLWRAVQVLERQRDKGDCRGAESDTCPNP